MVPLVWLSSGRVNITTTSPYLSLEGRHSRAHTCRQPIECRSDRPLRSLPHTHTHPVHSCGSLKSPSHTHTHTHKPPHTHLQPTAGLDPGAVHLSCTQHHLPPWPIVKCVSSNTPTFLRITAHQERRFSLIHLNTGSCRLRTVLCVLRAAKQRAAGSGSIHTWYRFGILYSILLTLSLGK